MKKIIFCTALISGVALFIGACAKRDDTTTTVSTVTCNKTASGSITVGSDNLSSSYLMDTGTTPVTGCIAMTSAAFPTGTQSIKQQKIITSSTTFAGYFGYFSDTACTTGIAYMYNGYSSLSVGDQITGLSTSAGGIKPSSAYKVAYKYTCTAAKGETDDGTEYLNFLYSSTGTYLTKGTEVTFAIAHDKTYYNIWGTRKNGNLFYAGTHNTTAYPSDWSSNDAGFANSSASEITCSTTASGSMTIGSDTVSSTYSAYYGSTPATGCNAMTDSSFPSGTQSIKMQMIITSSTTFVNYVGYFSDTACATGIAHVYTGMSDLSVGSQVTGLSTSGGKPSSAYNVTHKSACGKATGETDSGTTFLNTYYGNSAGAFSAGTEKTWEFNASTSYNIWGTGNSGSSFYVGTMSTAYPSDWTNRDNTYVK